MVQFFPSPVPETTGFSTPLTVKSELAGFLTISEVRKFKINLLGYFASSGLVWLLCIETDWKTGFTVSISIFWGDAAVSMGIPLFPAKSMKTTLNSTLLSGSVSLMTYFAIQAIPPPLSSECTSTWLLFILTSGFWILSFILNLRVMVSPSFAKLGLNLLSDVMFTKVFSGFVRSTFTIDISSVDFFSSLILPAKSVALIVKLAWPSGELSLAFKVAFQ